ncbi:MAG: hypothetical protein HGA37_01925 [Lentimicrobium sp.]|nr:hypothetical protein [Lentimicrobium sp.]
MIKFITIFIYSLLSVGLSAQSIHNNGAHIVSQSGTFWVIDNGNFTLKSESATNLATMANLNIGADASLTLTPTSYLTVNGTLSNSSGIDGLVLQSTLDGTSSLIQSTNAVDATINRYITGSTSLTANTYHLVSVPLTPATNSTSNLFFGSYLFDYDVASDSWQSLGTSTATSLDETKGYMIYAPEATHTYTFAGPMNAGSFTPTIVFAGAGNNLVPNPYPSAIDWDATSGWTKDPTKIANSVYIWPSGAMDGNYAAYVNGVATFGGSRYIPAGQSFFVKAIGTSPVLTMNDNVRVHNNKAFFKDDEAIPDLLRILAVSNDYKDEAVVRFTESASASSDYEYDAWKFYGSEGAPQLYSLTEDNEMLAINSLPPLETSYIVPLNFEMSANKQVTFTFKNIESFDPSVNIFLKDELSNQTVNLRNQQLYTFNHDAENAATRFKLVFGGTIGVEEISTDINSMWISGSTLYIHTPELTGQTGLVEVYNASGQKLISRTMVLTGLSTMELHHKGFVVVKLTTGQKVITVKGILIK